MAYVVVEIQMQTENDRENSIGWDISARLCSQIMQTI